MLTVSDMTVACVKKGGASCLVKGLLIVIFVSLMMFRTERQLINPCRYRLIGHLHDGVILLLRPQSFSFFLSYPNFVIR